MGSQEVGKFFFAVKGLFEKETMGRSRKFSQIRLHAIENTLDCLGFHPSAADFGQHPDHAPHHMPEKMGPNDPNFNRAFLPDHSNGLDQHLG